MSNWTICDQAWYKVSSQMEVAKNFDTGTFSLAQIYSIYCFLAAIRFVL